MLSRPSPSLFSVPFRLWHFFFSTPASVVSVVHSQKEGQVERGRDWASECGQGQPSARRQGTCFHRRHSTKREGGRETREMTSPGVKRKALPALLAARRVAVVFFPIVISFQPSVSQRLTADIYFFCPVGDVAKRGLGLRQTAAGGWRGQWAAGRRSEAASAAAGLFVAGVEGRSRIGWSPNG